jgi:hypothetical protein
LDRKLFEPGGNLLGSLKPHPEIIRQLGNGGDVVDVEGG